MSQDLRRRVVRAIGATTLGSGLAKLISLLSTLVLARLLTPEDFGLMAIATTTSGFIGFFNEVGIGAAIVQRTTVRDAEINGCFGIAMLASSALCGLAIAVSWPIADFFAMPKLQPVMAVLGVGFYFGALNTVPVSLLRRDLRLQAVLWLGTASAIVQSLVAIPLALIGLGYWALVISFFLGQAISTFWYWRVATWRPTWPVHLHEGRALLGYGLDITFTRILWHSYMNADKLIVGKMVGAGAVGIYDVSKSLANLPTAQITGMVTSIASPVFARLQSDITNLGAAVLRLTRGLAYITIPILAGLGLLAHETVSVLLGPQWATAAVPLQALCISEAVAAVINNLQAQLLISTGRVRQLVRFTGACAIILPLAMVIGAHLGGITGLACALACVYPILNVWLLRAGLRVVKLSHRDFWRAVRKPIYGSLMMSASVATAKVLLQLHDLPPLAILLGCTGVGTVTYAAFLIYWDHDGLTEVRQVLADVGMPVRYLDGWPFIRGRRGTGQRP